MVKRIDTRLPEVEYIYSAINIIIKQRIDDEGKNLVNYKFKIQD